MHICDIRLTVLNRVTNVIHCFEQFMKQLLANKMAISIIDMLCGLVNHNFKNQTYDLIVVYHVHKTCKNSVKINFRPLCYIYLAMLTSFIEMIFAGLIEKI